MVLGASERGKSLSVDDQNQMRTTDQRRVLLKNHLVEMIVVEVEVVLVAVNQVVIADQLKCLKRPVPRVANHVKYHFVLMAQSQYFAVSASVRIVQTSAMEQIEMIDLIMIDHNGNLSVNFLLHDLIVARAQTTRPSSTKFQYSRTK